MDAAKHNRPGVVKELLKINAIDVNAQSTQITLRMEHFHINKFNTPKIVCCQELIPIAFKSWSIFFENLRNFVFKSEESTTFLSTVLSFWFVWVISGVKII